MHAKHRPSTSNNLKTLGVLVKIPPPEPLTSIGRCWLYMVSLVGEPRSPRSRLPGARRPPYRGFVHEGGWANGHYLGTDGGHWVLHKKCVGSLGNTMSVRNSNKYHDTIYKKNMFAEMCRMHFLTSFICVLLITVISIIMQTKHRPSTLNYLSKHVCCYLPLTRYFYRQMLVLRGPFGRAAPLSPIANSRRKKATTLWVCPWGMISQWALLRHQWGPFGAAKNIFLEPRGQNMRPE